MLLIIYAVLSIAVIFKPFLICYLLLLYMFIEGLAHPSFFQSLRVSIGSISLYPLDVLFFLMFLSLFFYWMKRMFSSGRVQHPSFGKGTRSVRTFVVLYLVLHVCYLVSGFLSNIPLESLFRYFTNPLQCLFMLVPLLFAHSEEQFRKLLVFMLLLALIFPFGQLLLTGTDQTAYIMKGQGTFRLGFGSFGIILAFAIIAIFCWEKKLLGAAIPGVGLIMLAHRSAYIAIVVSLCVLGILRGKRIKTVFSITFAGVAVIAFLLVIQASTSIMVFDSGVSRINETFANTGTTNARFDAIGDSYTVLKQNPITGIGYSGIYKLHKVQYEQAHAFNVLHPHNFILKLLSTSGVLGTCLFLYILFKIIKNCLRLTKSREYHLNGCFILSSLLYFIIFSLMNTTFSSSGYAFWTLSGIGFWFLNIQEEKDLL